MSWSVISATTAYPANAIGSVAVTLGDLVCFDQSYTAANASPTVSDNAAGGSNSYSQMGQVGQTIGTTAFGHSNRAKAKASETLTITSSQNPSDSGVHATIARATGGIGATPEDGASATSSDVAAGTSHTGGSVTPTASASVYVHTFWFQETADATLTENGQSFIKESEVTNHVSQVFDRIIASASGSYNDAVTSNVSVAYNSITQAYKETTGGGSSFSGSESETLAASDTITGVLVDVGAISENGSAVDAVTGVLVDVGTIGEAGAAADTVSGPVSTPGNMTETVASADSVGATIIPAGSAVETLVASDVVSSPAALLGGSIVEGSALVDAVDATGGTQTIIPVDQPSTAPGLGGGGDPGHKRKRVRPVGKRRYLNQDGTITSRPEQTVIAPISPPSNVVPFARVKQEPEPEVYADLDAEEMDVVMQLVING